MKSLCTAEPSRGRKNSRYNRAIGRPPLRFIISCSSQSSDPLEPTHLTHFPLTLSLYHFDPKSPSSCPSHHKLEHAPHPPLPPHNPILRPRMPHLHRQPRRRPALAAKRTLACPAPRHRGSASVCAAEVERGECKGQGGEGGKEEEGGEESG